VGLLQRFTVYTVNMCWNVLQDVTWQGLQGVSVRIESGQCVGIMGPSGTGKSTLLHLITGQCQPQQGTISINGVDLQDLDLSALWGALGFVPQEPFLQNDTVLEAIRCAQSRAEHGGGGCAC
jgi:ATP-binding cassette subfamily B protein